MGRLTMNLPKAWDVAPALRVRDPWDDEALWAELNCTGPRALSINLSGWMLGPANTFCSNQLDL